MATKIFPNIFIKKSGNSRSLVRVCAWCPKEDYPALKPGQKYTHGMCKRHYKQLSIRKNMPISFHIAEMFETTVYNVKHNKKPASLFLFKQSKKYLHYLKSALLLQLQRNNISSK